MKFPGAITSARLDQSCPGARPNEWAILLHGLCRSNRSMAPMAAALESAGYRVLNIQYPSRSASIDILSEGAIGPAVRDCCQNGAEKIHFVTHSLGGILARSFLSRHTLPQPGRIIMLGPPNQGSEIVDKLGLWRLFKMINGPAGTELGTGGDSTPNRLGPAHFCVGIIAGNRSINWINSLLIPGPNDGKVSVERTRLAGMADHLVIPCAHPFLMRHPAAIRQTLLFLANGRFHHSQSRHFDPNPPTNHATGSF